MGASRAIWTAWPADEELWLENLGPAQAEVAAMVKALAAPGPDGRPGDRMKVLVHGPTAMLSAREGHRRACGADRRELWRYLAARHRPDLLLANDRCALFTFNGWGGKYVLDYMTIRSVRS
jgi:agmatine deiminase